MNPTNVKVPVGGGKSILQLTVKFPLGIPLPIVTSPNLTRRGYAAPGPREITENLKL
jgi:hypothetical protein